LSAIADFGTARICRVASLNRSSPSGPETILDLEESSRVFMIVSPDVAGEAATD
jgi:hypothetical protein